MAYPMQSVCLLVVFSLAESGFWGSPSSPSTGFLRGRLIEDQHVKTLQGDQVAKRDQVLDALNLDSKNGEEVFDARKLGSQKEEEEPRNKSIVKESRNSTIAQ